MHLDLALLLSEAKGELRFYKSEVLKDVLYYSSSGEAVPFIQPLSPASGRVDYESPPTGCIAIFQQKFPPESKKRIYFFRKI